jgi:hypothetical protein
MIYTSSNNWYSWSYNNVKFSRANSKSDLFTTEFNIDIISPKSFKEELLSTASNILDHFNGLTPCVMFSGGIDSELVLRSFLDVGCIPEVLIFRYEDDINVYDVSYAVTVCSMLDVSYKIIDFNLKKFYEHDAEKISEESQVDRAMVLPQLKFMDYTDNYPVYGEGVPSWNRTDDDYSKKGKWLMSCWEHDIGWSKYAVFKNRPAVMEYFKWTPELMAAWNSTSWVRQLINDYYWGKLGTNSTKIIGYKEAYPDLLERKKKTGYEQCLEIVNEFEIFLEKKYNGFAFRRHYDRTYEKLFSDLCQNLIIDPSPFER